MKASGLKGEVGIHQMWSHLAPKTKKLTCINQFVDPYDAYTQYLFLWMYIMNDRILDIYIEF